MKNPAGEPAGFEAKTELLFTAQEQQGETT